MSSVLVVITIYGRMIEQVAAIDLLLSAISQNIGHQQSIGHILIFDNSNQPANIPSRIALNPRVTYYWSGINGGIRAACHHAIGYATTVACRYIMLLDQDTIISFEYLLTLASRLQSHPKQDCFIPFVRTVNGTLSPSQISIFGARSYSLKRSFVTQKFVTAIASGSVFSLDFLSSITPFPCEFWLDNLDHWIFFCLYKTGRQHCLLPCFIEHDLSVQSIRELSKWRASNIAKSELMLYNKCFGRIGFLVAFARLIARSLKYFCNNRAAALAILRVLISVMRYPRHK